MDERQLSIIVLHREVHELRLCSHHPVNVAVEVYRKLQIGGGDRASCRVRDQARPTSLKLLTSLILGEKGCLRIESLTASCI